MQSSSEDLLGQLLHNNLKKKVISIKGIIICNITVPNQRNKVVYVITMISATSKSLSCYISNFSRSVEVLLKKTSKIL